MMHPIFREALEPFMPAAPMIRGDVENRTVYIDGIELDPKPSQKLYNHSPDGYMWGYNGSGPSQLALAILLELAGKADALRYYQEFKRDIIAGLDQYADFDLSTVTVRQWLASKKEQNNA